MGSVVRCATRSMWNRRPNISESQYIRWHDDKRENFVGETVAMLGLGTMGAGMAAKFTKSRIFSGRVQPYRGKGAASGG